MRKRNGPTKPVVLISAPWPLFSRPSIQLGTLKAYLKQRFPELTVNARHFYLRIAEAVGYRTYRIVSERTWLAESVYGALLYPKRRAAIKEMFYREAVRDSDARGLDFDTLVKIVRKSSLFLIQGTDWGAFELAGFSMSLCQLTSSLYFIRQIKRRHPNLQIVIGGSMVSGTTGRHLIRSFPEIDHCVNGEGELPLEKLITNLTVQPERLSTGSNSQSFIENPGRTPGQALDQIIGQVPGTMKQGDNASSPFGFSQLESLEGLPPPDYDEYFEELDRLQPEKRFFPTLPVEASRGCGWSRRGAGKTSGCAFCNLNLQWQGYRTKRSDQVAREVDFLTTRHRTLSVAFMDNMLPLKISDSLFERLRDLRKDLKLFGEIRADFPPGLLRRMKQAGVSEVQIGIEALSTRLLKKMNKGTTAMANLAAMRNCEALKIVHRSNLILHFPGSDAQDAAETLKTLEYASSYRPLRAVSFWLGLESPVWRRPESFSISKTFNHPNYGILFPETIDRSVRFPVQAYRGGIGFQRKIWKPVKESLRIWSKTYSQLAGDGPILSFRDGTTFLIIRQKRISAEPATHRLEGTSRKIYLFCLKPRSIREVRQRFPGPGEEKTIGFIRMMQGKKLMFVEDDRVLSLAVPAVDRNGRNDLVQPHEL
ncbi:MAG: RiPP maturation radical SAM protein 1 [Desulfobacteraceae bacterium]|nr:MAG: RiPP maturation radical SAM protein 1 [Desulfobacteraceae bacterium]